MAIVVGNSNSANNATLAGTITGFAVADIPYRIMVVCSAVRRTANSITGITCNGKAFTNLGVITGTNCEAEIWYLLAPDVGTYDISITWTGSTPNEWAAGAFVAYGVHQGTPFGTLATATGSSTTPSVNVTSGTDELVIDGVAQQGTNGGVNPVTVGASQTQIWQNAHAQAPKVNSITGASSYEAGDATVTMSWTATASTNWAIGGAPLKPAPVALLIQ